MHHVLCAVVHKQKGKINPKSTICAHVVHKQKGKINPKALQAVMTKCALGGVYRCSTSLLAISPAEGGSQPAPSCALPGFLAREGRFAFLFGRLFSACSALRALLSVCNRTPRPEQYEENVAATTMAF
jgi:hypothetical protein